MKCKNVTIFLKIFYLVDVNVKMIQIIIGYGLRATIKIQFVRSLFHIPVYTKSFRMNRNYIRAPLTADSLLILANFSGLPNRILDIFFFQLNSWIIQMNEPFHPFVFTPYTLHSNIQIKSLSLIYTFERFIFHIFRHVYLIHFNGFIYVLQIGGDREYHSGHFFLRECRPIS